MGGLAAALQRGPIVIDGGLGTRLESRGNDVSSALWSADILRTRPDEVRAAHLDYFRAGSRAATTASYQVTYDGGARFGIDADEVDALLRRSVALAREARDESGWQAEDAWILASVGPYGASRGDGSEYTGAYDRTVPELQRWHERRVDVLTATAPDALLCETIPSIDETRALAAVLQSADRAHPLGAPAPPVILSFTVADGALRSGDRLADAARVAERIPGIVALGVNCSSAADATAGLRALRSATALPLAVYPNSGETWNARTRSWNGGASPLADAVTEWVDLGAALIGGCCRVDTAEISEIDEAVLRLAPATRRPR